MRFSVILAFAMLAVLFTGCKKSDDGNAGNASGSYYMRFKVDGVQKEYLQNVAGSFNKLQPSGKYGSSFTGTKDPFVATKDNMTVLLITNTTTAQNVTYVNYTTTAAGLTKGYIVQPGYYDEKGDFYTSWSDDFIAAIPAGTETNAKVTVTAASSTSVKVTFSGVLYNANYSKKIAVTEGDFYIKLQ